MITGVAGIPAEYRQARWPTSSAYQSTKGTLWRVCPFYQAARSSHPFERKTSNATAIWRIEKRFLRSFHAYVAASASSSVAARSFVATQWTVDKQ